MRIIELSDYSMTIMKDSEDPPWVSIGDIYRKAVKNKEQIAVDKGQLTINYLKSSDYIYGGGRIILYFEKKIKGFKLQDRVNLYIW